ncbi:DUF6183 family protein [Streptomyces nigra]|uniref:DUF6183 family protein n=1 Tax=Streptomyces nigra TaxID=1827580 RepID=UPI0036782C8B
MGHTTARRPTHRRERRRADGRRKGHECDCSFGAATEWFEGGAWDIGLVSVAPGARRIAVLAATDTD